MAKFKVGDILKHKEYSNIREILAIESGGYRTKQLTPGRGAAYDYGRERLEFFHWIDSNYDYKNPLASFVKAKLAELGYTS